MNEYTVYIFTSGSPKPEMFKTNNFKVAIRKFREGNTCYATLWRNSDNRLLVQQWK